MRFDGKRVVIIGGSSGIGLETARLAGRLLNFFSRSQHEDMVDPALPGEQRSNRQFVGQISSNLAESLTRGRNAFGCLLSQLSLRNKPFGHHAEGLSDCRDENGIARTDYSGHSPLLGSVGVGKCF